MSLAKPNYVEMRDGQINKLFCQVCGDQIAGMTEGPMGSGPNIHKLVMKFRRFHNYSEVKLRFTDGTFHVTNGCHKCLMGISLATAQEMYDADMEVMGLNKSGKVVEAIVAMDSSGSGLL